MSRHQKPGQKNSSRTPRTIWGIPRALALIWILTISVFAFAPFITWYESGQVIARGDLVPFFETGEALNTTVFSFWTNEGVAGINTVTKLAPLLVLYKGLTALGFSLGIAQIAEQSLLIALSGVGAFLLTRKLFPSHVIAAPIASMLYIASPFMVLRTLNIATSWTMALLPFIMAILQAAYQHNRKWTQTQLMVLAALLTGALLGITSINPPTVAVIAIGIAIQFFIEILVDSNKRTATLLVGIGFATLTILLSLYWIVPTYYELFAALIQGNTAIGAELDVDKWAFTHSRASIINVLSLTGSWVWIREYMPFVAVYNGPLQRAFFLLPTAAATIGTILIKKEYATERKRNTLYLCVILLLAIVETGVHPPAEQLFRAAYNNIPGFKLFRDPFAKFGILHAIFLAPLAGIGISSVLTRLRAYSQYNTAKTLIATVYATVAATIVLLGFPLVTGQVIPKPNALYPYGSHIQLPEYYNDATHEINTTYADKRIIVSPENTFYQAAYEWGYYGNDTILDKLLNAALLRRKETDYTTDSVANELIEQYFIARREQKSEQQQAILSLLQTDTLLQKNDIQDDKEFTHFLPYRAIEEERALSEQTSTLLQRWGRLELRDLDIETKPAWITTSTATLPKNWTTPDLVGVATNNDIFTTTIVEQDSYTQLREIDSTANTRPNAQIDVTKTSSANLEIKVNHAPRESHVLVVPFKFDPGWELKVNDEAAAHIKVNGYMNGYIIPSTVGSTYTGTMRWKPQQRYNLALLATIIGVTGAVFILAYNPKP